MVKSINFSRANNFIKTRSIFFKALICVLVIGVITSCKQTKKITNVEPVYEVEFEEIEVVGNIKYKGEEARIFSLQHVTLHLTPNWKLRTLDATAELALTPHAYPQDSLKLHAKAFNIQSVTLLQSKGTEKPLQYKYNNKELTIKLDKTYKPGEKLEIKIDYTAQPEKQYELGVIKKKGEQGLFFIDPDGTDPNLPTQLWTQGEVQNNSAWFPVIDWPNQRFTQEIFLTVHDSYKTLSNGQLAFSTLNRDGTRTDCWQLNKPHAPYLAMIAVGKWEITEDEWRDSVPVEYYLEPEFAPYAHKVFGNTPEMLEFYSKLLGYDYPWPKYSQLVVREFVSGAMENTTAVIHYDVLQHDDRAHLDETSESIIAHELFHHWFGDLVTAESWSQLALNESFATYGERLWEEYKYGDDAAAFGRQNDLEAYLLEAIYAKEPIINHFYAEAEDLFDRHRYEKGGLVLHMLRTQLGDSIFFKALQIYLQRYQYKAVELAMLRQVFEEVSGQDLNWFFKQWFLQAGHPQLNIRQKWDAQNKKLLLITEQTQSGVNVPTFILPVEIHIYTGEKMLRHKIMLKNRTDTFSFMLDKAPLLVNFDAQKYLLAQKSEIKPIEQWYYQYFNAPLYADKYEALMAISNTSILLEADSLRKILNHALAHKFWNIRKRAIDNLLTNSRAEIKAEYIGRIKNMALNDADAKVRLVGLQFIEEAEAFSAVDMYRKALKDSSYKMVAAGIYYLQMHLPPTDTARFVKELSAFENYRSADVLFAVANVYVKHPDPKRLNFIKGLPKYISTYEYGRYFDLLKRFYGAMPAEIIANETDYLLGLGTKANEVWSKMSYKLLLMEAAKKLRAKGNKTEAEMLEEQAGKIILSAD